MKSNQIALRGGAWLDPPILNVRIPSSHGPKFYQFHSLGISEDLGKHCTSAPSIAL